MNIKYEDGLTEEKVVESCGLNSIQELEARISEVVKDSFDISEFSKTHSINEVNFEYSVCKDKNPISSPHSGGYARIELHIKVSVPGYAMIPPASQAYRQEDYASLWLCYEGGDQLYLPNHTYYGISNILDYRLIEASEVERVKNAREYFNRELEELAKQLPAIRFKRPFYEFDEKKNLGVVNMLIESITVDTPDGPQVVVITKYFKGYTDYKFCITINGKKCFLDDHPLPYIRFFNFSGHYFPGHSSSSPEEMQKDLEGIKREWTEVYPKLIKGLQIAIENKKIESVEKEFIEYDYAGLIQERVARTFPVVKDIEFKKSIDIDDGSYNYYLKVWDENNRLILTQQIDLKLEPMQVVARATKNIKQRILRMNLNVDKAAKELADDSELTEE